MIYSSKVEEIKENEYIRTTQGTITRIENTDWRSKSMSDEENKAFQYYKECNEKRKKQSKYLEILLNLIEKQSKEIEELNKSDASKEQSSMKYYNLYKELVDKIKAKIEELKKYSKEHEYINMRSEINVLQSLLKEEE